MHQKKKAIAIFLGDERLITPTLACDDNDKTLLMHLRMFYRMLKIRRGLSELILPELLVRMDWVEVSYVFQVAAISRLNHAVAQPFLERSGRENQAVRIWAQIRHHGCPSTAWT
jgi:hypothetical protein